jgi:hypothetical protein
VARILLRTPGVIYSSGIPDPPRSRGSDEC